MLFSPEIHLINFNYIVMNDLKVQRTKKRGQLVVKTCSYVFSFENVQFHTYALQFWTVVNTWLAVRFMKNSLLLKVFSQLWPVMGLLHRVVQMIENSILERPRHWHLENPIDGCYLKDQYILVFCIFSICRVHYSSGLPTKRAIFMLCEVTKCWFYTISLRVTVPKDFESQLTAIFKPHVSSLREFA